MMHVKILTSGSSYDLMKVTCNTRNDHWVHQPAPPPQSCNLFLESWFWYNGGSISSIWILNSSLMYCEGVDWQLWLAVGSHAADSSFPDLHLLLSQYLTITQFHQAFLHNIRATMKFSCVFCMVSYPTGCVLEAESLFCHYQEDSYPSTCRGCQGPGPSNQQWCRKKLLIFNQASIKISVDMYV